MLLVCEGIDSGNAGEFGKLFDILLRKGANDRPMNHSAEDASGILDRFAAAELNVARAQEQRLAAQLANAHFKRDARAGRGFGK